MKKLIEFLTLPWRKLQDYRNKKRRLADLLKRDPFIYK